MDYVQPIFTRHFCDSTREKQTFESLAMVISGIFTKKVTRLLDNLLTYLIKKKNAIVFFLQIIKH